MAEVIFRDVRHSVESCSHISSYPILTKDINHYKMVGPCFFMPQSASKQVRDQCSAVYFISQLPKQPAAAMGASDMSEMEREFMRAPDDSSDESDDDEEALNQCSDDDSELAPEDF